MTKKESQPENKNTGKEKNTNLPYDPDISEQDKEVLNNQSKDQKKGAYFKDREEPIDYVGDDLDIPGEEDRKFNPTTNKPQDIEKRRKPKESANSNDNIASQTNTVYKGENAEKYKDPSEKSRKEKPEQ